MSFLTCLDEEYFQLQDFLSTLIDTLPTLNVNSIPDDKALIKILIEQNKAYAKKVTSLYKKLNSVYLNPDASQDKSERPSTNAFVDKLKEKLQEYEEEIQRLKLENETFSDQIKQLSVNNNPLKAKDSLEKPFFNQKDHPQSPIQSSVRELSPNARKSANTFNTPSPIARSSNVSRVSKDASFDLDQLFQNAEYKKAIDALNQLDYQAPQHISLEKFTKWLAISHKVKDSQFNEIFQKLKTLAMASTGTGGKGEWESQDKGLEDSLDLPKLGLLEKIMYILDEKLAKDIVKKNYKQEEGREQKEGRSTLITTQFKDNEEGSKEGIENLEQQLKQKIQYLKESLNETELRLRDREAEIRQLREIIREANVQKEQAVNISRKSGEISDRSRKGRDTREEEDEIKTERDIYRKKYENVSQQLEEYKLKYHEIEREVDEYRAQYEDIEKKVIEISGYAERLKEENDMLKKETRGRKSSRPQQQDEKDGERYYENRSTRLDKEAEGTDIAGDKSHQRTPTVGQIGIAESSQNAKTSDFKGNLLLENALQAQKSSLYNTKQLIGEFKAFISEKCKMAGVESQLMVSPKRESEEPAETSTETQKAIKANIRIVKEINNDLKELRKDTMTVFNKLSGTKLRQLSKSIEIDIGLREKIYVAEEKLMENLSQTLQGLSQLTASIHDMGSAGLEGPGAEKMAPVLDSLHELHSKIEKTIQEFPEFAAQGPKIEGRSPLIRTQLNEPPIELTTNTLRKKLATDRNDLATQLRTTLKRFDSSLANDVLERLSEEIERNQELQDMLEAKNLLLHRLNLLFNEGLETCEISIRHLRQLADSEDAQRIIEAIFDNLRAFKRTFVEANIQHQYRSPSKKMRGQEGEGSTHSKGVRSKSEFKSSFKEGGAEFSSKGEDPKDIFLESKKSLERERSKSEAEELEWLPHEKEKVHNDPNNRTEELKERLRNTESQNLELNLEIQTLRDSLERSQAKNEELKDTVEKIQEECKRISREAIRDVESRNKEIEEGRRKIEHLEREMRDLRDYRISTEGVLRRASDQVGQLKLGYFSEVNLLKEENVRLENNRQELVGELERKIEENAKLNQLIDTLQKFSNKQMESLREKEDKITILITQKRESEALVREMERQIETLAGKNKKSLEKAKESMDDVTTVRYELNKASERQETMQRDLEVITVRNKELAKERENLVGQKEAWEREKTIIEEKMKKMSELLEITKNELRRSHELIELKTEEIHKKDKEIQRLRESNLQKEDRKEPDYVTYLKRELQARNEELQRVKDEYRKVLDANERLSGEINEIRATNRLGAPSIRQSISSGNYPQQSTRKEFYGNVEKGDDRVIKLGSTLKRRNDSLGNVAAFNERQLQERVGSGQKNLPEFGGSGNIIHNKEKEIQRLNQVVKDLAHSLKDSQNSANQQIRRHIQFSSPQ